MSETYDCRNCGSRNLPRSAFGPHGAKRKCKACESEYRQMHKHGLTSLEKEQIAKRQDGCGLCGRLDPGGKGWVVDHDRSCCPGDKSCISCRRAVLCQWCNNALGYAFDNPELLRRMADYLALGTRLDVSHVGVPHGSPTWDSIRTNETNGDIPPTSQMDQDLRNARAGVGGDEWIRVGEVLPGILERHLATVGQRHEVIRTGERDEIATHVRAAIWYRDGGRCKECGATGAGAMHLDHITPWSAGGSDTTDNLRILCEPCNMRRSNFIDDARQARPATWWCLNCYDRDGYGWDYANGYALTCSVHGSRSWECRVTGRSGSSIKHPPVAVEWHEREPMIAANATTLAYCAHCDAPGMTDMPL